MILSIDQGTTGTRAVLYNNKGEIAGKAYREIHLTYPRPGWVEQDPLEIWNTVVDTVEEVCSGFEGKIAAVGITNQRETTVLWDRKTSAPVYNAIVWQCRRTAGLCENLRDSAAEIRKKTGLPVDAYFSATKIQWILGHQGKPGANLAFGNIDAWLIWKLTNGKMHATDYTNASRTMLFNIHQCRWDRDLCSLLKIPEGVLPKVQKSAGPFGMVESISCLRGVPILGVAGDQQAALFGQACFDEGQAKNTYGTGCFLLMNTGEKAVESKHGLLTTLAVDGKGNPCYALEGSVFIGGAAIQWLRDELGILAKASDSQQAAGLVADNGGVYLVPAFVGLGAPHWDMQVRGLLTGLTRGSNRNHIIRAALESMAFQSLDVLRAMEQDSGMGLETLAVDGGASANDFLMQFQADILGRPVLRPAVIESTSLGAAYLAGLQAGIWKGQAELAGMRRVEREFVPALSSNERSQLLEGWQKALRQTLTR